MIEVLALLISLVPTSTVSECSFLPNGEPRCGLPPIEPQTAAELDYAIRAELATIQAQGAIVRLEECERKRAAAKTAFRVVTRNVVAPSIPCPECASPSAPTVVDWVWPILGAGLGGALGGAIGVALSPPRAPALGGAGGGLVGALLGAALGIVVAL